MKAEYARIASDVLESWVTAPQAIHDAVARCEALANKPVRELTPEEIEKISDKLCMTGAAHSFARAVIAAHIAKQSEPEEIPFDQKKLDEGGWETKLYWNRSTKCPDVVNDITKVTLVRKT